LIDVRTRAEWAFVGITDLSALVKQPVQIEWQTFPDGQINPSFVDQLISDLVASGTGQDTNLYFICRSGGRSLAAARAMAEAGFRACHNVSGGFEGPPDENRHRGAVMGWKAAGLPWVQG
ncbi:MAG: rhodanese-like domain-containing protein, partial [Methyloligellaceae bacterium]